MSEPWQEALASLSTECVPGCLLCDSIAGEEDRGWSSLLALRAPFAVRRCPNCGLRWLSPRPDGDGYVRLYSDESYFGGTGASPTDYEMVVATRLDYFRKRFDRARRMLGRREPLSVLDFGAATGEFVALVRREGHGCDGIELSRDARASALERHGVRLLAPEQASEFESTRFDLLHSNHVLEHMPNPLEHLRWCRDVLKPDGLLVLEVPQQFANDLDRARRALRLGGRQARFDAYSLHHTYFFTPGTLASTLRAARFEPVQIRTFNPDKTPLWPPDARNWILRGFLGLADRLHGGGNIIEVFARPQTQREVA